MNLSDLSMLILSFIGKTKAILDWIYSWIFSKGLKTKKSSISLPCEVYGVKYIHIGAGFKARKGLWLHAISQYEEYKYSPRILIGVNVALSKNCHIACIAKIRIGNNVLIGSNVLITDHHHGNYASKGMTSESHSSPNSPPASRPLVGQAISIGNDVFIGDNCAVLPGANIGDGSIIGANSVVNTVIPAQHIAAGNPARIIKRYCQKSKAWVRVIEQIN